jgi:hypothetical protein
MSKEKDGSGLIENAIKNWASEIYLDPANLGKEELDDVIYDYETQVLLHPGELELKLCLASARLLRNALDIPSIEASISKIEPRLEGGPNYS